MKRSALSLLAIGLLLMGLSGCKKEEPKPEQRWLRVYNDGEFEDSIDITGWEKNEDVVRLGPFFYYPWQGEDSITYMTFNTYQGVVDSPGWMYLTVNGRVVGVNLKYVDILEVPDKQQILTVISEVDSFSSLKLKHYPNLVGINFNIDDEKDALKLLKVPYRYKLYLDCRHVTDNGLKKLSCFGNIRALEMWDANEDVSNQGLKSLTRLKELRVLIAGYPQIDSSGMNYIRRLKKIRVVDWNAGCIY